MSARPTRTQQLLEQRLAASSLPHIPRTKRIGRISPHREIMCRRCARWMLPDATPPHRYHHLDDGTPACVDPQTLAPYPDATNADRTEDE